MKPLFFKRHDFPAVVIRQAVWFYFRFSLSLRDVEELMAACGIDVSYETISLLDHQVRSADRPATEEASPSPRRRLDEAVCSIGGKSMFL